jgi:Tfp pilus assembly protein PilN
VVAQVKMGALVKKLEEEYSFGTKASGQSAPVVVTVSQNQQVSVTVTPIEQIIDSTQDEDIRKDLRDLKQALETEQDPQAGSKILNSLQQKSWEVFIKVLPYVLEHWGHLPR